MLAQVLLVDPQHVRRRGEIGLHVVVELEAVELAHVLRFRDPQHDALEEAVEAAEHLLRRDLDEVPRAYGALDGFEQGVLADALKAAEDEPMIDLLVRPLHAMGEQRDDVVGFVGVDRPDMRDPRPGLRRVAG